MLGEKLKRLRLRNNCQQKDIVEYLNVAKSTYSQYESGKSEPDYETLKKIATFYNVSLDYLLGHEVNEEIGEGNVVYNHDQLKKKIVKELGDDIEIHFYDATQITEEQLRIIKAIVNVEREKDKK